MNNLIELAERCEAAERSDRVLDAEITCAVKLKGLRPARPDDFDGKFGYSPGNIKTEHGFLQADRYTSSIDAALSVVPEGWGGSIHFSENRQHRTVKLGRSHPTNANTYSEARSDALALCAAALRARAVA